MPVVLVYIPDYHLPPFTVSCSLCSVSPSVSFSLAAYLPPAAFPPTSRFASSHFHLNWISLHSTSQHCFSPVLSPLPTEVHILPPYIWIRQLSPPYYWGTRKRWWTGQLFCIPFSLPTAAPSSAHSSSRHSHRRCFPTRHGLRCSAGMERAYEDIATAGRWPARKVSSGDLNSKETCKFLPQICPKCRFHMAYNLIKPEEIFTGMKKSHLW